MARPIGRHTSVDVALRRAPGVMRVFLGNHLLCIGCPLVRIHTIEDACVAHGIDADDFMRQIDAIPAIAGGGSSPRPKEKAGAGRARRPSAGPKK